MELVAAIGLEIHVQMNTKSKMFSTAPVGFGGQPNTRVALLDMAFPGAMPVVNKEAVINAIRVCHALNMTIDNELWFDRKNYFYSDLAKGYQISQHKRPIGKNGYLDINGKRIIVDKLQIEEDTCKQLHLKDCSLLDYNRSGIPLLEIVSKPEITTGEEAMRYVEKIKSIVSFLGVSNGKMEEGSLRCDVNISLKEKDSEILGAKVEIKNLNTLSNIKRAVEYEINRQKEILLNGGHIEQDTRRFNEQTKKTMKMRLKTDSVDYKFFIEPNLPPVKLSEQFINDAIKTSPELAEQKYERYLKLGLSKYDSTLLTNDKEISDYYDETISYGVSPKLVANWVNVDIQTILKKNNILISDFSIRPDRLSSLIKLIETNQITNKQGREIFSHMLKCSKGPKDFVTHHELTNDDELKILIDNLINDRIVKDYQNGKDKVVGYIVGQILKATQGKVNPSKVNKMVLEELKRR